MVKNSQYHLSLETGFMDKLKELAKEKNMKYSKFFEMILQEAYRKHHKQLSQLDRIEKNTEELLKRRIKN